MNDALPLLPLVVADVPASLRRMLMQEGVPQRRASDAPTAGRFVLYDSRRRRSPQLTPDQTAIDVDDLRRVLGGDPFAEAEVVAARRTAWRVGPWTATEETAARERGLLRRRCLEALRGAVERAGGVWARVAAVPHPYRTAFSFRFDHDAYDADDFHAVLAAVAGRETATTHFVCAATHERHPEALARLRGLDVGSHGYRHHAYLAADENRRNIRRGIEVLQRAGLQPCGYAAPHGRFHPALPSILRALGVPYGSEFGLAYDDLPFAPDDVDDVRAAAIAPLQIPIHPVCLGIVFEALSVDDRGDPRSRDRVAEQVARYFIDVATAKHARGEPIFLYGHPDGRLGRHPEVLRRLFAAVERMSGVWWTNFSEFDRWWRRRALVDVRVEPSDAGWTVTSDRLPDRETPAIEIETADGIVRAPLAAGPMAVRNVVDERRSTTDAPWPRPVGCVDATLRERVRRWIDWERTTPLDDIPRRPLRNRIKRALRRWEEPA